MFSISALPSKIYILELRCLVIVLVTMLFSFKGKGSETGKPTEKITDAGKEKGTPDKITKANKGKTTVEKITKASKGKSAHEKITDAGKGKPRVEKKQ